MIVWPLIWLWGFDMNNLPLILPRSSSVQELSAFASEIFRTLGQEFGYFINEKNSQRRGTNWFQEYCSRLSYQPNLYDPEFLLKEPDAPNSWCRWCLPHDRDFHENRRRIKRFRNRWAHFADIHPEELAEFLSNVRKFTAELDLPMSRVLPRLQEHIRYLADNPEIVLSDERLEELKEEINLLKVENDILKNQMSTYTKWFPTLSTYEPHEGAKSSEGSVCLHFRFEGFGHLVKAKVLSKSEGTAEIQFQLPMGIPLGEGDVVSYKGPPSANCVSMTAIVGRHSAYRIQVSVDYQMNLWLFAQAPALLSRDERFDILLGTTTLPHSSRERLKNLFAHLTNIPREPDKDDMVEMLEEFLTLHLGPDEQLPNHGPNEQLINSCSSCGNAHGELGQVEVVEMLWEIMSLPDGPETRWKKFWTTFPEALGELNSKCAVIDENIIEGTAVLEVSSRDLALSIIESAQLQDHGNAWMLSTPESPMGPLAELARFSYQVGTDRAVAEAIRLGWYLEGTYSEPDLNRVVKELYWEPVSDVFMKRN